MLRQPAVAGQFYPANPQELERLVLRFTERKKEESKKRVKACLVPHAGYVYSGHVAGAVFGQIELPKKIVILGVRHFPRGEDAAILTEGAWRTPLGDAPIDSPLARKLLKNCALLKEDSIAHEKEHSLEVQIPFLQVLAPKCSFVPIALGTIQFDELQEIGKQIARTIAESEEEILLLTTSDLNHYEDDATTRKKDAKAISQLEALDARGLFDVCRAEKISMCGLGPVVAMIVALNLLGATRAETVKYATSADVSGDYRKVVGYAGMIFN